MRGNFFDVIVIGAGHAGCEAGFAVSRMGLKTLIITINLDRIAHMPCAPAVGGVGKGHIVREIDALGGMMGYVTDLSAIQFKTLNTSKGLAVHSTRAQVDKLKYSLIMKKFIENQPNLYIRQALITKIIPNGKGVILEDNFGFRFFGKAVIITAGTFLGGLIHIGNKTFPAGRAGEFPANDLSVSLKDLGFELGRFKTGTGPRFKRSSIDFSKLEIRPGDGKPRYFSCHTKGLEYNEYPCYVTYTNEETHSLILDNLDKSALYGGYITGTPVRYCPSLEDKVVKFRDKERHQVILEPEGTDTDEIYVSGLGNSMPPEIQEKIFRSPAGLENVVILRPAYAIEYDYVLPHQLKPTLESKIIENLYFAGQINGTTGYEEAGGQGIIAGINAGLKVLGKDPLILDRTESYIGVMIDDLVTKGTDEPYRIFTSRAEYRLFLREDNVYYRLSEKAFKIGLISETRMDEIKKELEIANELKERILKTKVRDEINNETTTLDTLIKRGDKTLSDFPELTKDLPENVLNYVTVEVRYEGYLERQKRDLEKFRNLENIRIPEYFDYNISGISLELREKLSKIKPANLGQASRISGITPSALSLLMIYLKKNSKTENQNTSS
ncbi:MAG: tRNA uridine-5-carboxymethylaminomethyl(34) synthesis enzyme MnmG [Proteobacteria bacterium]|nr:tRNA uridine-5-carboxymethylaminomethyl(34) synthesis enzyme MnmG [Pseudomonadota bacterium]